MAGVLVYKWWQTGQDAIGKFASLPLLLGLLNGIIPFVLYDLSVAWLVSLPVVIFSLPGCSDNFISRLCKSILFWKISVSTLLGAVIVVLNNDLASDHYTTLVSAPQIGLQAEIRILDTSCVGEGSKWLGNPHLMTAELLRVKFSPADSWQRSSGRLMVKCYKPISLNYGDKVIVSGDLSTPSETSGEKDFSRYLRARSVYRILTSRSIEKVGHAKGFMSGLCAIRNSLLERTVRRLDSQSRALVAALMFGCRQGVDYSLKQTFFMSGTSHAFAISGLHIGMFTTIILGLGVFLPVRFRYLILPFMLLFYVCTIGMKVSAVRALLMISVWAFHRCALCRTSALNGIFFVAFVLLIQSPYSVFDASFLYSFITVFFLVMAWRGISQWRLALTEPCHWNLSESQTKWTVLKNKIGFWLLGSALFSLIAWLASAGLTFLYHGLGVVSSPLVNVFLIPVLMCMFVVILVHACVPAIAAGATAWAVELIVSLLLFIARLGADSGLVVYAGAVSLLALILYYSSLHCLILSNYKRATLGFCGIVVVCCWWSFSIKTQQTDVFVVAGGGGQPVIVVFDNVRESATLLNSSSRALIREVKTLMRQRGIHKVDSVVLAGHTTGYYSGADLLCGLVPVDRIHAPLHQMKHLSAQRVINRCRDRAGAVLSSDSNGSREYRLRIMADGYHFEYKNITVNVYQLSDGVFTVSVFAGDKHFEKEFENGLGVTIDRI